MRIRIVLVEKETKSMSQVALRLPARSLYLNGFLRSALMRGGRRVMRAGLAAAFFLVWFGLPANVHGQAIVRGPAAGGCTCTAATAGGAVSSITVAYSAAPLAGHLLVAVVSFRDTVTTLTVTSNAGAHTWTNATISSVTAPGLVIAYATAAATDTTVVATETGGTTHFAIAIYEFSGVSTTPDKTNAQSGGASTNPTTTPVSVIPTKAPNLVIAAVEANSSTAGANWGALTNSFIESNDIGSTGSGSGIEIYEDAGYKINAALGSVSTQDTFTGTTSNGWRAAMVSFNSSAPTAADGVVSGTITDNGGAPVSGAVVTLSGTQSRKTITDANGNYHFDNVETTGFYTLTPSRANFGFAPSQRSFSLLGDHTEAAFTASSIGDVANPLDATEYFVRQEYVDILGREPDEGGFNYWSDQINACGGDANCTRSRRVSVAAAFFIEAEFQQSGSFIYGFYKGALGRQPRFAEYSSDRQQIVSGANLDAAKAAFADSFVQRAEFAQRYQSNTTADSFVDALLQNVSQSAGLDLSSQRDSLISRYNTGANQTEGRSLVVRDLAESAALRQAEYNAAFVLTEYFNYLRRDPEAGGYDFWLNVLNSGEPGNYRGMVCSFITSAEYQRRFSGIVSHTNSECGR
jgi:hypothetical protein